MRKIDAIRRGVLACDAAVACNPLAQDVGILGRVVAALRVIEDEAQVLAADQIACVDRGVGSEVLLACGERHASEVALEHDLRIQVGRDEAGPVVGRKRHQDAVEVRGVDLW
ncbi:hypothetical protein D3C86_1673430 [compost metagenome]